MFDWLKRNPNPSGEAAENGRKTTPATAVRADMLWRQGSKLLERRKTERAVSVMRQAFELEPSRLDGRLNLGAALFLTGQLEEAVTHLKYVLAFEPQNTMALLNLAACHDGLGNMDESIAALEKLVADRPQWKDAHYNLAVAYYKQRQYEKALDALKAELQLNPNHEAARTLLNRISLYTPNRS
jgi:tetratricopeptide (TPR) repeat protein